MKELKCVGAIIPNSEQNDTVSPGNKGIKDINFEEMQLCSSGDEAVVST